VNNTGLDKSALAREWLDLRGLTQYAAVSERTLRLWIHAAVNPLPAVRVGRKVLVRRAVFDSWLERHVVRAAGSFDLDATVNEVLAGLEI